MRSAAPGHVRRAAVLLSAALLVGGCGGGEDAEPPTPSDPTDTATSTTSTAPPDEVDASDDLSGLVCAANGSGTWDARGVLTSSASSRADYSVTVVVTGPDETSAPGRRRLLPGLEPGVATPFTIRNVPVVGAGEPTCQVRVARLDE
jgi:hypothetical protein